MYSWSGFYEIKEKLSGDEKKLCLGPGFGLVRFFYFYMATERETRIK